MGDIFVAEIPIFFLSTVVAGPQPTYEEKIRVPPPPPPTPEQNPLDFLSKAQQFY